MSISSDVLDTVASLNVATMVAELGAGRRTRAIIADLRGADSRQLSMIKSAVHKAGFKPDVVTDERVGGIRLVKGKYSVYNHETIAQVNKSDGDLVSPEDLYAGLRLVRYIGEKVMESGGTVSAEQIAEDIKAQNAHANEAAKCAASHKIEVMAKLDPDSDETVVMELCTRCMRKAVRGDAETLDTFMKPVVVRVLLASLLGSINQLDDDEG